MAKSSIKKTTKPKLPVHCVWGLMCISYSIDQKSNLLSLYNIIENFALPQKAFDDQSKTKQLISAVASYQVVLYFKRLLDIKFSSEEILLDLKIKVVNSKGNILSETATSFNFMQGKQNMRLIIDMKALAVDGPGLYLHKVEMKGFEDSDFIEVLDMPFEVKGI